MTAMTVSFSLLVFLLLAVPLYSSTGRSGIMFKGTLKTEMGASIKKKMEPFLWMVHLIH